jgi:hypothetical protein
VELMSDSPWTYWICDVRTGVKLQQVYPKASPFDISIFPGGSQGSTDFRLGEQKLSRDDWRDLTTPWARKIVIFRNGVVVYEGIFNSVPKWDRLTKMLSVTHVDIENSFLQARHPFGVKSYYADTTYTKPGRLVRPGLSLPSAAAVLVAEGLVGPLPNYGLPIVLPSQTDPGDYDLVVENYSFLTVADGLDNIRKQNNGPDIFFEAGEDAAGAIWSVMRVGSTASPRVIGERFPFVLDAPRCGLTKVLYGRDAIEQYTGIFTLGTGGEADLNVGTIPDAVVLPAIIPARETTQSFKTEDRREYLNGYSIGAAAAAYRPVDVWDIELLASDPVAPIEKLKRGSVLDVFSDGDLYIPDGWHALRVVAVHCDMSEKVKPTVQKMGA